MRRREQEIEAELIARGYTAPRVTPEEIDAMIITEQFHVPIGTTLTICTLTLDNGFVVIGKAGRASPANYDKGLGERLAYEDARRQVWELAGFRLRDKIAFGGQTPPIPTVKPTDEGDPA